MRKACAVKHNARLLLSGTQSMIFLMENGVITDILNMTAWRMDAPPLFGGFHIIASLLTAAAAVPAAAYYARRINTEKDLQRILSLTGWILLVLEVFKQLFLYHIVNGGAFDLWFFPFQLCSVPMYLCILLPLPEKKARAAALTFMGGYTFVSAAATLIYPADILRPYTALTVHGFVWHGLLLFISLLIILSGAADHSARGLLNAAVLFAALCCVALGINVAAESVMPAIRAAHPSVAHDWAAMFYLNPYHISPQPVVDTVQRAAGIPAGLMLYALTVAAAGSLAASILPRYFRVDGQRLK